MEKVIRATPSRENWELFCIEEPLTKDEWREWRRMAAAIRADDALLDLVIEATAEEKAEADAAGKALGSTQDWSDFVENADAGRRLQRAELVWWQEYQTKGEEHGTDQETDVR